MDNDLINAFYRDFHEAKDRTEERQAIVKSCKGLKLKEQARVADLAADAAAIIWLVRQRWGATVDVPGSVPEGEILVKLSTKVPAKKLYGVKHLIAKWGPTIVRHYRFDQLGEQSLRQLVHAAGKHREWDDFVDVANSVMLWRHEQCATSTSSQKNKAEFLVGQYPVACKASSSNRPLLPCDIENIKKAIHTDFATPERLRLWTSPCVTCFEMNVKHQLPGVLSGNMSFLLLKKDTHNMLVPSSRANRACSDCCAPAIPMANKKRKRPRSHVAELPVAEEVSDSDPQALLSSVGSLSPAPRELDDQFRLEDAAKLKTPQEKQMMVAGEADSDMDGEKQTTVAHGKILQAPAGPSSDAQKSTCPFCLGKCTRCDIPEGYSSKEAVQLYSVAHRVSSGSPEGGSSHDTLLSFIRFVDPLNNLESATGSSGSKAWILPWGESLKEHLENSTSLLPELLVIRGEQFSDASRYNPQQYAEMLRLYCGGKAIPTRVDGDPSLEFCDGDEIADHLLGKSSKLEDKIVNVLSLKGITNAAKPSFTQILRYCFLQALIHRAKAEEANGNGGKQTYRSPFDVSSCADFNILGFEGAYSGAHVDLLGATWLRCLFGRKLWWYVPRSAMETQDWKEFKRQGAAWNPRDKAKAVLLNPGDTLVMFEPVVHLVYTVDTCLMEGGMFCDSERRLAFVDHIKDIASMPNISNEPLAYQLPVIITELEKTVQREEDIKDKADIKSAISQLRATGCKCSSCDKSCDCRNRETRCTNWCRNHPVVPHKRARRCMLRP